LYSGKAYASEMVNNDLFLLLKAFFPTAGPERAHFRICHSFSGWERVTGNKVRRTQNTSKLRATIGEILTKRMTDLGKACRICHDSDDPLFYPCKCSGSIKYVHAECLKHWLHINRRKNCEVCGEELSFQKEFTENAPRSKFSLRVIRELLLEGLSAAARVVLDCLALAAVIWFVPALSFLLYRISFLLTCGCGWPLQIWVGGIMELISVVGFVGLLDCLFLRSALLVRSLAHCRLSRHYNSILIVPLQPR
jgi:hypothetical protein